MKSKEYLIAYLLCAYQALKASNETVDEGICLDFEEILFKRMSSDVKGLNSIISGPATKALIPFKVPPFQAAMLGLCASFDEKMYRVYSDQSSVDLGYLRVGKKTFCYVSTLKEKIREDRFLQPLTLEEFFQLYLPFKSAFSAKHPTLRFCDSDGSKLVITAPQAVEYRTQNHLTVRYGTQEQVRIFEDVRAQFDQSKQIEIVFSPEQLFEIHTLSMLDAKIDGEVMGFSLNGELPEVGTDQEIPVHLGFIPDFVTEHPLGKKKLRMPIELTSKFEERLWWFLA